MKQTPTFGYSINIDSPSNEIADSEQSRMHSKLRNVATTESFHFVFSGGEATFHKLASKYGVILDKYPGCVNQKNNSWLKPVLLRSHYELRNW